MMNAGVTVTLAVPLIPSLVAVIVIGPPGATAVTTPLVDTATVGFELDDHAIVRPVSTLPATSRSVAVGAVAANL